MHLRLGTLDLKYQMDWLISGLYSPLQATTSASQSRPSFRPYSADWLRRLGRKHVRTPVNVLVLCGGIRHCSSACPKSESGPYRVRSAAFVNASSEQPPNWNGCVYVCVCAANRAPVGGAWHAYRHARPFITLSPTAAASAQHRHTNGH